MEDMKANELMIGDKVMVKVLSQIPDTYVLHTWTANDYSRDIQVKPITLTPEILEKNGFGFVKSSDTRSVWNGQWIYKDLELATCCLDREGNWPCFINIDDSNIKCEYVHQLQHALRLCRLDELADNFKV